jgi:protein TonB
MIIGRSASQGGFNATPGMRLKSLWKSKGRRFAPLSAIVLVHVFMFYLLQSGMLRQAVPAMLPPVVQITFVAQPETLKPAPPPKTVQVAVRIPTYTPPLPQLNIAQVEPTITVPPPQAHVVAAVAVSAPAAVSTAPPAPPAPSVPKTVTGVEYVRAPQAVYPNISRRMGESGTVMLRVLIGEKGLPEQAVVHKSSGSSNLDEAGRQAVMRALYKPYIEDGKAVPVYVLVPINFQIS